MYISPSVADARKVEVFQLIGGAVQPGKPAQFMVRKNGATGNLDAKLISPSGVEDDCFIAWVEDDVYSIRYVPKENGIHNIHVKFNGVHITGSPFRVKVNNLFRIMRLICCAFGMQVLPNGFVSIPSLLGWER